MNVSVEYLNVSFLVKKPNGGTRLVLSFGDVGSYSKPQPALILNVHQVLRDIASWDFSGYRPVILLNPTVTFLHEIVWGGHTIQAYKSIH